MTKVPRGPAATAQTAGHRAGTRTQTGEVSRTAPPAPTTQPPGQPRQHPEPDELTPPAPAGRLPLPCAATHHPRADLRTGTLETAVSAGPGPPRSQAPPARAPARPR